MTLEFFETKNEATEVPEPEGTDNKPSDGAAQEETCNDSTAPDNYTEQVHICTRIREAAKTYNAKIALATANKKEADELREQLAIEFATYKAMKVGKGRDGEWSNFIKDLGFKVRTVDRWISNKLATGQLPAWVAERLTQNADTVRPDPKRPDDGLKICSLVLRFGEAKHELFGCCVKQLGFEKVQDIIFEAVTRYQPTEAVAKPGEPDTLIEVMENACASDVPTKPKHAITFVDDVDEFLPKATAAAAIA